MSTNQALEFIRQIRSESNSNQVGDLFSEVHSLEELLRYSKENGFSFSSEEFKLAHNIDWCMRWQKIVRTGD